MNVRKIKLETNKFPPDFHGNYIYDNVGGSFFDNIDIVLEELCAKYFLENYNDSIRPVRHYDQFDALHYLKDNIEEFIFKEGHPGAEQESRRIDSQILGQTICRYVIEKTFGSGFISHVKPLLGKKFPGKFASISINRCKKGDSPDYIFMDNLNKPCLAEAKGRRDQIEFTDPVFTTWREQFSTVEVKIKGNLTEVKGYIMALVIANENNSISNSTLYVEDPVNEGEVYRDGLLGELIQMAHYERILSRSWLNFIGNSLLSEDKLSKDKKYEFPIYRATGVYELQDDDLVPLVLHNHRFDHFYGGTFVGITLRTLERLLNIARGNDGEYIRNQKPKNFNDVFFMFTDGFVVGTSYLLDFYGFQEV